MISGSQDRSVAVVLISVSLIVSAFFLGFGARGAFLYAASVLGGFFVFAVIRLPRRPSLRRPAKRLFQAIPRTTHVAADFPRSHTTRRL
ncbi:MAG: hypothetical protein ACLFM6_09935 [Spirochaetaceae bacterium]